jgi:hypothetical protein
VEKGAIIALLLGTTTPGFMAFSTASGKIDVSKVIQDDLLTQVEEGPFSLSKPFLDFMAVLYQLVRGTV